MKNLVGDSPKPPLTKVYTHLKQPPPLKTARGGIKNFDYRFYINSYFCTKDKQIHMKIIIMTQNLNIQVNKELGSAGYPDRYPAIFNIWPDTGY